MKLSDDDFKRVQWHSRRGMLELDVLLEPFTNEVLRDLSAENQQVYVRLLDCQDADLFSWFMSEQRPDDKLLAGMIDTVITYARRSFNTDGI
ncbi:FAD assembly factor SdhE [Endozoicomonas euniceicola]|uniref:FAD assembly factor SdhE n=1 Tax=Endozoicomonas euniceicola TaxID=1234143 RepID=A0ABY6GX50_9GAMM|nr:succinate dehydrogenase assembly factor 2 [Endozoicomonas euniceicola]UYM16549.1 succinate dehydrogenase assembly factor 2 [Endozoicomonas euniceicola]